MTCTIRPPSIHPPPTCSCTSNRSAYGIRALPRFMIHGALQLYNNTLQKTFSNSSKLFSSWYPNLPCLFVFLGGGGRANQTIESSPIQQKKMTSISEALVAITRRVWLPRTSDKPTTSAVGDGYIGRRCVH